VTEPVRMEERENIVHRQNNVYLHSCIAEVTIGSLVNAGISASGVWSAD
jgi:hypothetical protein